MKKEIVCMPVLALVLGIMVLAACATSGKGDAEQAAEGVDVFAGKNWNATSRNDMYDRWEFNTDSTFRFRHVHHGEPLDRGLYRYEAKNGVLTVTREGTEERAVYAYVFSGKTVTLTPLRHGEEHADTPADAAERGAVEHGAAKHTPAGGHQMGALPEAPVTFTHVR